MTYCLPGWDWNFLLDGLDALMPLESDAKNSFSPGQLEETTGMSSCNKVEDIKSENLSQNEAIDMARN